MAYKIRATLKNEDYIYQGFPHHDEVLAVSVWNDDVQFPIGEVAGVMYGVGEDDDARESALASKYGADFARAFVQIFSEDLLCGEIDVENWEYHKLGLCIPLVLTFLADEMKSLGVVVVDERSDESKRISTDILKLRDCVDEWDLFSALYEKERRDGKRVTQNQAAAIICRKYHVCKAAASLYLDTEFDLYACRDA